MKLPAEELKNINVNLEVENSNYKAAYAKLKKERKILLGVV